MTSGPMAPGPGGALDQLLMISVVQGSSVVLLVRNDRKQARLPLDSSPIRPGSPIKTISHFPAINSLLLETIRGDGIAAELPTTTNPAPFRNRPVIYLDQKDWSSLAKYRYDPEKVRPLAERKAAGTIIDLVRHHKIILPISAGHMSETCKWTNSSERYKLALTMLELSQGWCMSDPLAVRNYEIRNSFSSSVQSIDHSPPINVFTLEANALHSGRRDDVGQVGPAALEENIEFVIDVLTAYIATADTLLDDESIAIEPMPGWVQRFQTFTDWLSGQSGTSAQKRKRIEAFVLSDMSVEIAHEAQSAGIAPDELRDWITSYARNEIRSMPSLGLFSEVLHQKHLNSGTNWNGNDLVDLMYLTCAAGYAQYVVGEKSLVSRMEQSLKRLNRRVNVYRNLRDLVAVLESDGIVH